MLLDVVLTYWNGHCAERFDLSISMEMIFLDAIGFILSSAQMAWKYLVVTQGLLSVS